MNTTKRICEVCDKPLDGDFGRCTNGRCSDCHKRYCTPGGVTSPGHGRRWPEHSTLVRLRAAVEKRT